MQLSSYQQAILEAVRERLNQPDYEPLRGILIEALAGTGKSFILVEICRLLSESGVNPEQARLVVFGKKNKADLADKLAKKVGSDWQSSVSTLHSLSYAILREALNVPGNCFKIESNKYRKLCEEQCLISFWNGFGKKQKTPGTLWIEYLGEEKIRNLYAFTEARQQVETWDADFLQLLELLRLYCYEPTQENIDKLIGLHKLDFPLIPSVINGAKRILDMGLFVGVKQYWIDYTDMSWVLWQERSHHLLTLERWRNQFRMLAVDECQDTDLLQLNILSLLIDPAQSFLVAVGDRRQAVYAFRGCVSDGLDRFQSQFNCDSYPLPVNYRCGRKHLELVRKIYPDIPIEAHPGASEGEVRIVKDSEFLNLFADPHLSYIGVCRKNAPLISAAIKLLGAGKPAKIKDKSIGKKIIDQIEKICKRLKADYEVESFPSLVEEFERLERDRLLKYDDGDQRISELQDLLTAIITLFEAYEPATIKSWSEIIDKIFDESGHSPINLYSIHSGKGGEGDVAFILNPENMPLNHKGMTVEEKSQERNLIYVALTRPQKILALISSEPQKISWLPKDFFELSPEPEPPPTESEGYEANRQRELAVHRYITALDQGDMDGVGVVLEAAMDDPELERVIGEINKAMTEEQPTEPEGKDAILQSLGFIQQNDYDLESMGMGGDPVEEVYRDWEIGLHAPNAGIIGVSIHQINEMDVWWWCPTEFTEPPFGYNDRDGVLNYAKRAIDQVEQCPGQLPLPLEVSEVIEVEKSEASEVMEVSDEFSDCPPDWVRADDELELCNLLEKLSALSKPRLRTVARELIDRLGPEVFAELLS